MDVFVVVNQDAGLPGVVVGAAVDMDAAYAIAERLDIWPDDIEPRWIVDLDTGVHSRRWAGVWQEIVRVPLAGIGTVAMTPAMGAEIGRVTGVNPLAEVQEIGRTWGAP